MKTRGGATAALVAAIACGGCGSDRLSSPPAFTDTDATEGEAGPGVGPDATSSPSDSDDSPSDDGTTDGPPDFPPPGPPGGLECPDLGCLPCGNGLKCAAQGPFFGDTCCAEGDSIRYLTGASGSEVVDNEAGAGLAIGCGGFGATFNDVTDPEQPQIIGQWASRCQHIEIGPEAADGATIVWLAHHGDTWVPGPALWTVHVDLDEGSVTEVDYLEDPNTLFEGVRHRDGVLYVAAHGGGLRMYTLDGAGVPSFSSALGGFENASRIEIFGRRAYVADGTGGVHILDLDAPLSPERASVFQPVGVVRDIALHGDLLYAAKGGDGVDVFDVAGTEAQLVDHVDTFGTAQSVDVDNDVLAVAAWSHLALYDRESLVLVGTEHTRATSGFEQDTSVSIAEGTIWVGEWEGLHGVRYQPGYIAPDLWIEEELVSFPAGEQDDVAIAVRNRGYLDLDISNIDAGMGPFTVDPSWMRVDARSANAFEILYSPDGTSATPLMQLTSNDADDDPFSVPLVAEFSDRIDVGDEIGEEFGFLDPSGQNNVENLRGHVVVLAYFALF